MKTDKSISREHLLYLRGRRRERILITLARRAVLIALLGVWELAAAVGLIDAFVFSSPSRIFVALKDLTASGELFLHAGVTLAETLIGFIISTAIGTALALLLWWNGRIKQIAEPYLVVLNSLPKIALGPVIIIWFGSGMRAIVVMTVLIGVVVSLMTMLSGFEQTDKGKLLLMRSLGASRMNVLLKLVIPSSLPTFVNMLKINVGLSWIGSIMGEYLVSRAGIGYLIVYGGQVFKMDLVFASTLVLCLLATGMYALVSLLERFVRRH
ncbi:MAG: ABC transporter permease [Clostridia bacterium]|nr:ABC transporter permease [Clostridia bacterium]